MNRTEKKKKHEKKYVSKFTENVIVTGYSHIG